MGMISSPLKMRAQLIQKQQNLHCLWKPWCLADVAIARAKAAPRRTHTDVPSHLLQPSGSGGLAGGGGDAG